MLTALLVIALVLTSTARQPPTFPGLMSIDELVAAGGYKTTNYEVITEDGYSLWLHRLGNNTGPPVLIQHGFLVSADSWISRKFKKSLPFMLLENGFDVWLSNQRGTSFNEYCTKYSKEDMNYWDFSFHESGYYDLPAFIDTILENRRKKKLFYIGHSMGTSVFMVMTSLRPEYNSKVQAAIFLSPVAHTTPYEEMSPFIRFISSNTDALYMTTKLARQYNLAQRTVNSITFLKNYCRLGNNNIHLCLDAIELVVGNDWENLNPEEWNFHVPYFLSGTSMKTFHHCSQIYQLGNFRQFNYGPEINMMKYNSTLPPKYNLSLVTTPVAMFWSYNDPLISEKSVNKLASQLPNLIFSKAIPDPTFTHIDMFIGGQAHKVLYPDIIKLLQSLL